MFKTKVLSRNFIKNDLESLFFGLSLALLLTVMAVLGSYYPRLCKYFTGLLFLYRSASIYIMFYFIEVTEEEILNDK